MKTLHVRILIITALTIAATVASVGPAAAQDFTVRLTEELRIGDDESAGPEYLFAWPSAIAVRKDGTFFVAESSTREILHYDAEGQHLETLGGQGEAPGEFDSPQLLFIDLDGALIVVDRLGQRITRYPAGGGDFETFPLMTDRLYQPGKGVLLDDGRLVLAAGTGYKENPEEELGIISIFNDSFEEPQDSFMPASSMFNLDDTFERMWSRMMPINLARDGNSVIYAVRNMHNGSLVRFENRGSVWLRTSIRGYPVEDPFYRILDISFREATADGAMAHRARMRGMNGPEGSFTVEHAVGSVALMAQADGSVMHFISTGIGDPVLRMELYDRDGSYRGSGVVLDPENNGNALPYMLMPLALDEDDRIFGVAFENGTPTVRVFRMKVEGL